MNAEQTLFTAYRKAVSLLACLPSVAIGLSSVGSAGVLFAPQQVVIMVRDSKGAPHQHCHLLFSRLSQDRHRDAYYDPNEPPEVVQEVVLDADGRCTLDGTYSDGVGMRIDCTPACGVQQRGRCPPVLYAMVRHRAQDPDDGAQETELYDIVIDPGSYVSGEVKRADSGPCGGLTVFGKTASIGGLTTTRTDPEGNFNLGPLVASEHSIGARDPEWTMFEDRLKAVTPPERDLVINIRPGITIFVRIKEGRGDRRDPYETTFVCEETGFQSTVYATEPSFSSVHMPPGTYSVLCRTMSRNKVGKAVVNAADSTRPEAVSVTMQRGGWAVISLSDGQGEKDCQQTLHLRFLSEGILILDRLLHTQASGTWKEFLPTGPLTLELWCGDEGPIAIASTEVRTGQEASIGF